MSVPSGYLVGPLVPATISRQGETSAGKMLLYNGHAFRYGELAEHVSSNTITYAGKHVSDRPRAPFLQINTD